jgi:hypothetical protein
MRICEQRTSESDHRIPEILIFLRHLELYHDWLWGNCNLLRPFSTLVTSVKLNLNMSEGGLNQAEHEQISTSLEVEQIGVNLFRSKFLWVPLRARGVYGGSVVISCASILHNTDRWYRQIISQALVSATNCIDSSFALHVGSLIIQLQKPQNSLKVVSAYVVIACTSFIDELHWLISY